MADNPFSYRIVSDPRRRSDAMDAHYNEVAGLQLAFSMLYVNRGRTVWDAMMDAKSFLMEPADFIGKVERLLVCGVVELNDDTIFLPLKPRTILDRLSSV